MEKNIPIKLAYDSFESAEGSDPKLNPVIFVHGYASDRKTWTEVTQIIADRTKRKIYAYDSRNYGDSSYSDDFSLENTSGDVFRFMNIVNAEKAVLVGHSLGAYSAMNAALQKPEKIEMLISEDTYLESFSDQLIMETGDYIKTLAEFIRRIPCDLDENEAIIHVVRELYDALSEENKKWTPKETLHNLRVPIRRSPDGGYEANYNVDTLYEISREFHNWRLELTGVYEGPSIFLWGNKSPLKVKSHEPFIRRYFPNAEFIEFDDGYHSLHSLLKEKFIDVLVELLNK